MKFGVWKMTRNCFVPWEHYWQFITQTTASISQIAVHLSPPFCITTWLVLLLSYRVSAPGLAVTGLQTEWKKTFKNQAWMACCLQMFSSVAAEETPVCLMLPGAFKFVLPVWLSEDLWRMRTFIYMVPFTVINSRVFKWCTCLLGHQGNNHPICLGASSENWTSGQCIMNGINGYEQK